MAVVEDRMQLLRKIQEIEFVGIELNLYLNTHPNDARALEQFNRTHMELAELKKCYEQQHGPLLGFGFGMNCGKTWRWAESPWPWEM